MLIMFVRRGKRVNNVLLKKIKGVQKELNSIRQNGRSLIIFVRRVLVVFARRWFRVNKC